LIVILIQSNMASIFFLGDLKSEQGLGESACIITDSKRLACYLGVKAAGCQSLGEASDKYWPCFFAPNVSVSDMVRGSSCVGDLKTEERRV